MKFKKTLLASCNKGDILSALYHLTKGADINITNSKGWFPLGGAVYGGFKDLAELLIEFGADINQKSACNWTPIYIAAWQGNTEIAKILIKCGANINIKTVPDFNSPDRYTPLHIAAEYGYLEIIRELLKAGASINSRDGSGSTPLDLADRRNRRKVSKYLKKRGGIHSTKYLKSKL